MWDISPVQASLRKRLEWGIGGAQHLFQHAKPHPCHLPAHAVPTGFSLHNAVLICFILACSIASEAYHVLLASCAD